MPHVPSTAEHCSTMRTSVSGSATGRARRARAIFCARRWQAAWYATLPSPFVKSLVRASSRARRPSRNSIRSTRGSRPPRAPPASRRRAATPSSSCSRTSGPGTTTGMPCCDERRELRDVVPRLRARRVDVAAVEVRHAAALLRRYARGCERLFHVCHEASRPAEIDVRLSRDADLVEDRSRQVTNSVEILANLVARGRPAVTNIPAAVGESEHEAADFGNEWMMLPITSRVQPQGLSRGPNRRQRVQHRQNRRCSDSCAEQHHRPLSRLRNEASTRQAHVECIAHTDLLPQVGSGCAVRLDLHAEFDSAPSRLGPRGSSCERRGRHLRSAEDVGRRIAPAERSAAAGHPELCIVSERTSAHS